MKFRGRSDVAESNRILESIPENWGETLLTPPNVYNDGRSEQIIGDWMQQAGTRDRIVLSTKVHGGGRRM